MPTANEYEKRISTFQWDDLLKLWESIEAGDTPEWESGKAFEYLVLRAFQLDGAEVRFPYRVELYGAEVEQIDGAVHYAGLSCLVESKNWSIDVDLAPIAKLRNQLMRRPAGTIGLIFSHKKFTAPATILAQFSHPQSILLWKKRDIEHGLKNRMMSRLLLSKYRHCVEYGLVDYNPVQEDLP